MVWSSDRVTMMCGTYINPRYVCLYSRLEEVYSQMSRFRSNTFIDSTSLVYICFMYDLYRRWKRPNVLISRIVTVVTFSVYIPSTILHHSPETQELISCKNKKEILESGFTLKSKYCVPPSVWQRIRHPDDIMYQGRMSSDRNYSYAVSHSDTDHRIKFLSHYSDDYPLQEYEGYKSTVPLSVWGREREGMFFARRPPIVTTADLAIHMAELLKANKGGDVLRYVLGHRLCFLLNRAGSLDALPVPVLLTSRFDENCGYMSSDLPGRTCLAFNYDRFTNSCKRFNALKDSLVSCNSSIDSLVTFLDHPRILLLVTTQQQTFNHEKVLSVPIGVRPHMAREVVATLNIMNRSASLCKKERLLLVNFNPRYYRKAVAAYYRTEFGEGNMYPNKSLSLPPGEVRNARQAYLLSLASSRFVICPFGLGADTYRLWEALIMGSFPIVESAPGLDRLYSRLPVLVVHSLLTVSLSLLEEAYLCFTTYAKEWKYEILTQPYWDTLILQSLETASISHIVLNHPERNPYCDFYEYSKRL